MWVSASISCDSVITCAMFYHLWKAKQVTRVRRTTNVLSRLISLTVETGLACTAISIAALLTFLLSRNTTIYAVPTFVVGKVYANSLLAVRSFQCRLIYSDMY